MLQGLTEKLRVIVHRGLQETGNEGPVLKRVREVANTVNDLLGKPIRITGRFGRLLRQQTGR